MKTVLVYVVLFIFSQFIDLNAGDKHTYGDYTGHYDYGRYTYGIILVV